MKKSFMTSEPELMQHTGSEKVPHRRASDLGPVNSYQCGSLKIR